MTYNISVTERADELLDNILYHLIYQFKNKQAAKHLLNEIEHIYNRLEQNPLQFPVCRDTYLAKRGYREAVTRQMDYVVVFSVNSDVVNIVGVFHQLENYQMKL